MLLSYLTGGGFMEVNETALNYKCYTCDEVDSWDSDERYELIDGELYLMASPLRVHQKISFDLSRQFGNFLFGKSCEAYCAPFAVYLNDDNFTKVEPDIVVVCDKSKLTDKGLRGAPDLIIEILSPSSLRRDKITKFNLYLNAGVREYWIVEPENEIVSVYILRNGEYTVRSYSETDTISVNVLEGCLIELKSVFEYEPV
jgi:Uma2 family endonuclease